MNTTGVTVDKVRVTDTIACVSQAEASESQTRNGRNDSRASILRVAASIREVVLEWIKISITVCKFLQGKQTFSSRVILETIAAAFS